tara:strand:+ start:65539 stop:66408 length:870 start_codon:yes stop_codon:yes gene_type:complete
MGRLLIIADQNKKCSATPRGLKLAARLGLSATVAGFAYAPLKSLGISAAEQKLVRERILREREQDIRERGARCAQDDQTVDYKAVWEKDIAQWVTRQCAGDKYLWVVKTSRPSGSIIHTSTDWQLLRECPAPVLLVAADKWDRTRPVLVALDLSTDIPTKRKLNHKTLSIGQALAGALEVELKIITAIDIPTLLTDLDLVDPIAYTKDAEEKMQPQIRRLAGEFGIPEKDFSVKRGPVEKVINSRAARVRAQIVVMGTVGRKGVKARLLGNTAEKVLELLKTDVLAVKP